MQKRPEEMEEIAAGDIQDLIHELQVHQVELEMQNEELRQAQQALERSRDRYSDLYEFAPVGYLTLDRKGTVLEANLTLATLLGVERVALIEGPLSRFIVSEDQDVYYHHRRRLFETQQPQSCELRMVRGDGSRFWVQIEAQAALDSEGRRPMSGDVERHHRAQAGGGGAAAAEGFAAGECVGGGWTHPFLGDSAEDYIRRVGRTIYSAALPAMD